MPLRYRIPEVPSQALPSTIRAPESAVGRGHVADALAAAVGAPRPAPARYSPNVISKRTPVTWPLPKAEVERAIRTMVRRIVDQFDPEQVILFGSRARGDARPDSDVDLMVVMPVDGSTREKAIEIRVALHDIPVPKDVAVVTPESFAWRKNVVGTVEWPAAHEGKVLHGRER